VALRSCDVGATRATGLDPEYAFLLPQGREVAPASKAEESITSRFPTLWRIVELPSGFAVEDATGKQIGVFYGRAPDSAGHTGIMTIDEARQMPLDFEKLPELLKQNGNKCPPHGGTR
jgi:hypothetical protein